MLLVQLGDLHIRVPFDVVDSLSIALLVWTFFIYRFGKEIFPVERRIFHIQYRIVAIISEHTPTSDPLTELQNDSDAESFTDDRLHHNAGTPLFRLVKCVTIEPNTQASVSVTTSCTRLIYTAPHLNMMQNQLYLPASRVVNALSYVPLKISFSNFAEEPRALPKRILIGIRTAVPGIIVHLNQAATIPEKKVRRIISLSQTPFKPYTTNKKSHEKTRWTDTTSRLVHNTPNNVRKFLTRLPSFKNWERDV